jgi:hypothetical protein
VTSMVTNSRIRPGHDLMPGLREALNEGRNDERLRSPRAAITHGFIKGGIVAVAMFYPAPWWKRGLGVLVGFFVLGLIVQFRAVRRERRAAKPLTQN